MTLRLASRRDADEVARFYRENDLHLCAFETPKPRTWLDPAFWRGEAARLQESWEVGASCRLFVFPRGPALGEPPRAVIGTAGLTSIARGVLQGGLGGLLAGRAGSRGAG